MAPRLTGLSATWRGQVQLMGLALIVVALMALAVCVETFYPLRRSLHALVVDTVPSVAYAGMLGGDLEDLDARSARYLATDAGEQARAPQPADLAKVHQDTLRIMDRDQASIRQFLFLARASATYPGEREAVDALADVHFRASGYIAVSVYESGAGRRDEAVKAYLASSQLLWSQAESRVSALRQINVIAADQWYQELSSNLRFHRAPALAVLILLGLVFGLANVVAAWRTHRVLTPRLAMGTILGLCFIALATSTLLQADPQLRTMVAGAFGTLKGVDSLKHRSNDVHAALGRCVVDRDHDAEWLAEYRSSRQLMEKELADLENRLTVPDQQAVGTALQQNWQAVIRDYQQVDDSLVANTREHLDLVGADADFKAFNENLTRLETMNQSAFDGLALQLQGNVDMAIMLTWLALPGATLLALWGLHSRLQLL